MCEAHTLLEEEARHEHVCVVGRRWCWRMKTSLTPRAIRLFITSSVQPTSVYPTLLSRCYSSSGQPTLTHLHQSSPGLQKKTPLFLKNCIFDQTDGIRWVASRNPVGNITDRKSAFSILVSDCRRGCGLRVLVGGVGLACWGS